MKYLSGLGRVLRAQSSSPISMLLYRGTPPTVDEIDALLKAGSSTYLTDATTLLAAHVDNLIYHTHRNTNLSMKSVFPNDAPVVFQTGVNLVDGSTRVLIKEGIPTWFIFLIGSAHNSCQNVMYGYIPDQMKVEPAEIKTDSVIYVSLLSIND